jgi:carbamate kinase
MSIPDQYRALGETSGHIARIIKDGWHVAIGHGNGPQVGFILRRSELSAHELHEVPLDVCDADTQGAIGYELQQNLGRDFRRLRIDRQAVTVVTQVEVDPADPAFANPSKPIGTFMDEAQARIRQERDGWVVREDAGRGWRRVVPSPRPIRIVEERAVKTLLREDFVVITVGGGGIPVVTTEGGDLEGVAAVIDKDFASALLATTLRADVFMISTAVDRVALDWGKPAQRWVDQLTLAEAKAYLAEGTHFASGSMAPKIEACIEFLEHGGGEAIITSPDAMEAALAGEAGTRIVA